MDIKYPSTFKNVKARVNCWKAQPTIKVASDVGRFKRVNSFSKEDVAGGGAKIYIDNISEGTY